MSRPSVFPSGGAMASFSSSGSEGIQTRGAFSRLAGQRAGGWGKQGEREGRSFVQLPGAEALQGRAKEEGTQDAT